ncbi:TonB-dependent receptor domain-containing protein [Carnimonas bestiolae]|uniref:TonB-dependent receptor domain-containing protein n=1 Tax=Carnimonas bestiolae TaxID=3402172 RepID=UPI003F4AD86F
MSSTFSYLRGRAVVLSSATVLLAALHVASANAAAVNNYNIAPAPLKSVLDHLAGQAGLSLSPSSVSLAGLSSQGVKGSQLSVEQALAQALEGTGIEATLSGGRITLSEAPVAAAAAAEDDAVAAAAPAADDASAAGATSLSTITVVGKGLAPEGTEPNTNYTARSSTAATRLNLAMKETPQSITTITTQQVKDQNFNTLEDVLNYTPGMTVVASGPNGAGNMNIYSRTFPVRAISMDGVPGSTFLLSGGFQGRVSAQDPFLYEKMEIIRGSTGLTAGSGDPSASLNFTRKHPYRDRQLSGQIKYGKWGRKRGELDVSVPWMDEHLRSRLAVFGDDGGQWLGNADRKSYGVSFITDADIDDNNSVSVGVTHYKVKLDGVGPHGITRYSQLQDSRAIEDVPEYRRGLQEGRYTSAVVLPTTTGMRNVNNAAPWSATKRSYTNLFATYDHFFDNGWDFKVSYNYADNKDDQKYGEMGTTFYLPNPADDVASYSYEHKKGKNYVNNIDANLSGSFELLDNDQDFVVGYNYYRTQHFQIGGTPVGIAGSVAVWNPPDPLFCEVLGMCNPGTPLDYNNGDGISVSGWNNGQYAPEPEGMGTFYYKTKTTWTQKGPYFATHWRLIPRTHLIFGGRWTEQTYGDPVNSCLNGIDASECNPNLKYYESSDSDIKTGFLPYGALVVELTKDINAYYSYAESYIENDNSGDNRYEDGSFRPPIRGVTNEGGLKGGFFNNRLNASIAHFDIMQKDFPDLDDDSVSNGYHAHGWELTLAGEITPEWRVSAGYVKQQQSPPNMQTFNRMLDDNNNSYASPREQFVLFSTYDVLPELTVGGGMRWRKGAEGIWVPPTANVNTASDVMKQKPYSVYDAMVRWRMTQQLALQLNVNNIFDKTYYSHENSYISGAPRNATVALQFDL